MCFNESKSAVLNFYIALCPFSRLLKSYLLLPNRPKLQAKAKTSCFAFYAIVFLQSKDEGIDIFMPKGTCNKVRMLRVRMVHFIY